MHQCSQICSYTPVNTGEAEFTLNILKSGEKKLAKQFNITFRYTDDVLSLNYCTFSDSTDLVHINEINDTTGSRNSASYLDLQL